MSEVKVVKVLGRGRQVRVELWTSLDDYSLYAAKYWKILTLR
jgi:hypothetical protein